MLSTLRLCGPSAVGLALVLGAALTTPGGLGAGVDAGAAGDVPMTTDSDDERNPYDSYAELLLTTGRPGDARARELCARVAGYRGLNVNHASVRNRAQ